jgi:hypothetical protein
MSNVEIVQYFNGEEQRVRRTARTIREVRWGIRSCTWGNGWGVKLRGTVEALTAIGATQTAYGQWVFDADPKMDRWVDCEVVK